MEIGVSLSALTPSQYRPFMKMWRPDPKLLEIFKRVSGRTGSRAMRLYFDFQSDKLLKTFSPDCPPEIKAYLVDKGYVLEDYVSGTVKDKHDRTLRLGKVLKDPALRKVFESDPSRKAIVAVTRGKKTICLSMHPYDVAGMSTGRGWTSCMNLEDGAFHNYVEDDVREHTLIAYLIDSSDKDIKRPLSRVLLKRFYAQDKSHYFYHVERVYPTQNKAFISSVQQFVNDQLNKELLGTEVMNGMYSIQEDLYTDTQTNIFPQLSYADTSEKMVRRILAENSPQLVTDMQWGLLAKRFGSDLFGMIFTEERKRNPSSFNSSNIYEICEGVADGLDAQDKERFMAKLSAYALSSEHALLCSYVLQQVLLLESPMGARIYGMNPAIALYAKRVAQNVMVWLPFARAPLPDRYALLDKFVDLFLRKKNIKDDELGFEAFANMSRVLDPIESNSDYLDHIERFKDVYPMDVMVENADMMGRQPYVMIALYHSANREANYEVSFGGYITNVIMRKMSEGNREKLAAYFGVADGFSAGVRVGQDPRFMPMFKEGAEVFNFAYREDGHGKVVFYPTTNQTDRDLRFGVEETILDCALSMMEDDE